MATLTLDPHKGQLRDEAEQLAAALGTQDNPARLIGPDGQQIDLPPEIFDALAAIAQALRRGDGVSVIPLHHLLTTNEAAELLNVSRPFLVGKIQRGEIPFEYVGTHRRLCLADVLAYRERREAQRQEAQTNLVRQAEELGLPY
jgi:excisionase family DNA binding protein